MDAACQHLSTSPMAAASPARRRWGAEPARGTVNISVSPAGSPPAVWSTNMPRSSSPESPDVFELSPEPPAAGYLPAASADGISDVFASSEAATDDDSDNLVSFLADLKNKYGLLEPPSLLSLPPAHPPGGGGLWPAQPVQAQQPEPDRHAEQPTLSVRVVVRSDNPCEGSRARSGTLSMSQPEQQQQQQQQQAACQMNAELLHNGAPLDTSWLADKSPPPAPAHASLINNPAFESRAASRLGCGTEGVEGQQAPTQALQSEQASEHSTGVDGEVSAQQGLHAQLSALEALQRRVVDTAAHTGAADDADAVLACDDGSTDPSPQVDPAVEQEPLQQDTAAARPRQAEGDSEAPAECAIPAQSQLHGRRLPWGSLHTLLLQRGFPGVLPPGSDTCEADLAGVQPDGALLFEALHSLLEDQSRTAAHQRQLMEAVHAAKRREDAVVAGFSSAAKRRDAEVAKWKRLALDNQVAARDAQLSSRRCGQAGETAALDAKRLQGLVQQLQHQLRSKEAELDRAREMLRSVQERDERRAASDQEALERLKRTYVASKASTTPGGAEAALKAAAREMRLLDICRVFEAERTNLAEQAAVAAADATAARAALGKAQEALHAAGLPCERFEEIEGQARLAARQAAAAEEHASQLAEEASMLRFELAARPTQAQYDTLKRQADIMERQLAKASADKAAAEQDMRKSGGGEPPSKQLSTREMIQRDRNMQRLGLQCVEELPKPVLVEVVQDACALLECRAPLELCGAIRPVQNLAALVPRMERFIGDVCGAVFQRGLAHVPEALRQDNPADVPAILATWIAELGELVETRGILRALLRQLASRVSRQPLDQPPTAGEVVPLVASLVELERQVFHSREVIQAAETALAAQPEVLIHRICTQFQRLFGCRSLEGVLPAMNKLYLEHTEAQTFLASLRTALGLERTATLEACANGLEQLLADRRDALATMLPAREPHAVAPAVPASAAAEVVEVLPAPRRRQGAELQQAAQVAVERMAARRHWPKVQIYVPAPAAAAAN